MRHNHLVIVGISGLICAGKTELAHTVTSCLGGVILSFRRFFEEEMESAGIMLTRDNFDSFSAAFRKKHGRYAAIERMVDQIGTARLAVVDSIRHPAIPRWLRARVDCYWGLYVHSPLSERIERLKCRPEGEISTGGLTKYDLELFAYGLGDVLAHEVDVVITNRATLDEYRANIMRVLDQLMNT